MTGLKNARWFEAILIVLLIVLVCTLYILIVATPPAAKSWELSGVGNVEYMLIGSNGTLYAFSGNEISAIDKNGSLKWQLDVPDKWKVLNNWTVDGITTRNESFDHEIVLYPITAERDDHLYVHAVMNPARDNSSEVRAMYDSGSSAALLAISPQGTIEWELPLLSNITGDGQGRMLPPDRYWYETMAGITERNGQLYVFSDYTEYVVTEDGQLLFALGNVSNPAAVDEAGNFYLAKTADVKLCDYKDLYFDRVPGGTILTGVDLYMLSVDPYYRIPSGVIESYDSAGRLRWSRDLEVNATRQFVVRELLPQYNSLPLYQNGSLFVPVSNGVARLDTAGNIRSLKQLTGGTYVLFEYMPLDSRGNTYLRDVQSNSQFNSYIWNVRADNRLGINWWEVQADTGPAELRSIALDGQEAQYSWKFAWPDSAENRNTPAPIGSSDGTIYTLLSDTGTSEAEFRQDLASKSFRADTIRAYDLRNETERWNFTVPAEDIQIATFTRENYRSIAGRYMFFVDLTEGRYFLDFGTTAATIPLEPACLNMIMICPGENITYLYFDYDIHEQPVIFNRSQALYVRMLYALDPDGRLLWKLPLAGSVTAAAANNSTFYYSTDSGRLVGGSTSVAAGIAFAALAYMVLRFLAVGAVSRARNRLDKNENRNLLLKYIVEHPGATARDLGRGMGLNFGTLRYHLFILATNHKIVVHQDGGYQRYFTNSNTYSSAERTLLSLMQREPVKKTLQILCEKPGITGQELQKELNLSMTATHKHVSLLVKRGIVARTLQLEGRSFGYAIKDEYRQYVGKLAGRL